MSLTFPLGLASFLDLLPIAEVRFRLDPSLEYSETGEGEVISHDIGARLWSGEIVLDRARHDELRGVEALIGYLHRAAGTFLVRDTRAPGPLLDPFGTALGAAQPEISEVATDGLTLSISGVPSGYALSAGDYLAFTYGSNPSRYALHRVLASSQAQSIGGGSFGIADIPVDPPVREGAGPEIPVELIAPACKARLVEADYGRGRSVISQGGVITWKQTLR